MDSLEILAKLSSLGTPPSRDVAFKISVGLQDFINRFVEETLTFASLGGAEIRFVYAPYGRGKTHLLWALQNVASQNDFVTAYIDCNAVQSPFLSYQSMYHIVANNMLPPSKSLDFINKKGVNEVIEHAMQDDSHELSKSVYQEFSKDMRLASDFRNLASAYSYLVLSNDNTLDIKTKLRALLKADSTYQLRISDLYRQYKWLYRPIGKLTRRNAASWLSSLCLLPLSLRYRGLAIFFDETEKNLSLESRPTRKRKVYLANLRNLVDHIALGSFQGCIIYYAVVEELLEVAKRELDALRQRLERIRFNNEGSPSNPRAVWINLDEITDPKPDHPEFFEELGDKIIQIGEESGLSETQKKEIKPVLDRIGSQYSQTIKIGAVREFVKFAASVVNAGRMS